MESIAEVFALWLVVFEGFTTIAGILGSVVASWKCGN